MSPAENTTATKAGAAGGPPLDLAAARRLFDAHGGTDETYLRLHYPRFASTWAAFASGLRARPGQRLLDIGAHWLHQTVLWRRFGLVTTAVDVPAQLAKPEVRRLAASEDITLWPCARLEQPTELDALPEGSFDLILLSEVIEHLAFNPVPLWRALYRLLAPGGAIVVTTPNYYALRGRAWRWGRFLRGHGGGISVDDILGLPDFGHHWREYSRAELHRYFALLSPDLRIERSLRLPHHYQGRRWSALANGIERALPLLRDQLYLEVALPEKRHGITIAPHW